jgi:hypothetical protein
VVFATKPVLAQQMIIRALDAGVLCAWVLGAQPPQTNWIMSSSHQIRDLPSALPLQSHHPGTQQERH